MYINRNKIYMLYMGNYFKNYRKLINYLDKINNKYKDKDFHIWS
jgi:hypothetical protein